MTKQYNLLKTMNDGIHYNGLSTVDVTKKYCFLQDEVTIDYNWSSSVSSIAHSLQYKGNK